MSPISTGKMLVCRLLNWNGEIPSQFTPSKQLAFCLKSTRSGKLLTCSQRHINLCGADGIQRWGFSVSNIPKTPQSKAHMKTIWSTRLVLHIARGTMITPKSVAVVHTLYRKAVLYTIQENVSSGFLVLVKRKRIPTQIRRVSTL